MPAVSSRKFRWPRASNGGPGFIPNANPQAGVAFYPVTARARHRDGNGERDRRRELGHRRSDRRRASNEPFMVRATRRPGQESGATGDGFISPW
jgi:hypothetical protein